MTRFPRGKESSSIEPTLANSAPAREQPAALGIYIVMGLAVAILGGLLFAWLAESVGAAGTLGFDRAVLDWMGAHQVPWAQRSVLEITALGSGSVVVVFTLVIALLLGLDRRRRAALLLLIATYGGLLLNFALKQIFQRPRPLVFTWGTAAASSSFPSGHAMNAAIMYLTIAFILTRLETRWWARLLTLLVTVLLIGLICLSRLYLGVHYPTDIIGGLIMGVAWVGICVSGVGWYSRENSSRESLPPLTN
jgi:undecaprenyl-diphosphatase